MKIVARNRRARFDYEILETVEAGIMLTGPEVKSCRSGNINLAGAYVSMLAGRPILKSAAIAPYKYASSAPHNPTRERSLLLKKRDIAKLESLLNEKGVTAVPLEVRAGKYIKVLLGFGRGRKKLDKRQRIRERETGRRLREGREV